MQYCALHPYKPWGKSPGVGRMPAGVPEIVGALQKQLTAMQDVPDLHAGKELNGALRTPFISNVTQTNTYVQHTHWEGGRHLLCESNCRS